MKLTEWTLRTHRRLLGAAGALLLGAPLVTLAGGPLYLCDSGVPFVWPAGGAAIPFNPDQGNLGPLSNPDAVALVTSAFQVWQDVPTATVTYANAGSLPVDVDITNFAPYLFPAAPDGQSAIVFDDTGEIFDLMFGPGSGILGFAGPEWLDVPTCTVTEGMCFLNGPAFTDPVYAFDVMVHEFGHYTGLAHTVVNGQIGLADNSGPSPHDTFGAPDFDADLVETMYPYYFGPGIGTGSLEADDVAMVSTLYPEPGYLAGTGTIAGTILSPSGASKLTGINVIARNVANPFEDAVSAISGDFSIASGDPFSGIYRINGLTPGASYAVYVDQILAGGFSTPPATIPGNEEFYNGLNESGDATTDDPTEITPLVPAAGAPLTGVDIQINARTPGEALNLGDDGSIELFLPFDFTVCEQTYSSVWVNANGNVTFGAADGAATADGATFLAGPPRVAALWHDLDPTLGGKITFDQTPDVFSIIWQSVPEFGAPDSAVNMVIKLYRIGNRIDVQYGTMTVTTGIAGTSCGFCSTGGSEAPTDLSLAAAKRSRLALWRQPANFEVFTDGSPFDLANKTVLYQASTAYNDLWAGANNSLATAKAVTLPFRSATVPQLTEIEPVGGDVDYFKFHLEAGDTVTAELVRGCFDSVVGIFSPAGDLVAVDDDGGLDLLSKAAYTAPEAGDYAVAVSAYSDFGFVGTGGSGGRYVLSLTSRNCPLQGPPAPANWLANGSFETGDLSGWTAGDSGTPITPWGVFDTSGAGFFRTYEPQVGCFLAANWFDGDGPMTSWLYQDSTVPAGEPFLSLEWKDRIQWDLLNYAAGTQDRTYAVLIVDPVNNSVLRIAYSQTLVTLTVGDTGWISHSLDVSEFVGQTIRVMFYQEIPEAFTGPAQFELDGVRLRSE